MRSVAYALMTLSAGVLFAAPASAGCYGGPCDDGYRGGFGYGGGYGYRGGERHNDSRPDNLPDHRSDNGPGFRQSNPGGQNNTGGNNQAYANPGNANPPNDLHSNCGNESMSTAASKRFFPPPAQNSAFLLKFCTLDCETEGVTTT